MEQLEASTRLHSFLHAHVQHYLGASSPESSGSCCDLEVQRLVLSQDPGLLMHVCPELP